MAQREHTGIRGGAARIEAAFARARRHGEVGVIPYLTVGFPDAAATLELVPALEDAGALVVELGVPFSDPLADGSTIQRSTFAALRQGVTLQTCLETCAELRRRGVGVPLVLMGYYNPLYAYGLDRAAKAVAAAGADGLIVADLPMEEADTLREACERAGLALVPLLAPTSSAERVEAACRAAAGFVYCVSLTGVTGAREDLAQGVSDLTALVRQHTDLGIAVGFGISRRAHVEALAGIADAVVVGSALISSIEQSPRETLVATARGFLGGLTGVIKPEHGERRS